jgi:hypothetical protein
MHSGFLPTERESDMIKKILSFMLRFRRGSALARMRESTMGTQIGYEDGNLEAGWQRRGY